MVTAGGSHLCVWDMVGGGRLLKKLTNFQKTVTAVRLSPMSGPESSAAPRLLAGSLDGHVKVRGVGCARARVERSSRCAHVYVGARRARQKHISNQARWVHMHACCALVALPLSRLPRGVCAADPQMPYTHAHALRP